MATAKVTDADRGRLTVKLKSGGYQLNLLDLTCLKLAAEDLIELPRSGTSQVRITCCQSAKPYHTKSDNVKRRKQHGRDGHPVNHRNLFAGG